mmetsp:Transcript_56217/g.167200  ORF Transcript_56217/g.167200 Transcript_56217/m.167200 type:complete len:231 (-) Transcript_56217:23-715(-)
MRSQRDWFSPGAPLRDETRPLRAEALRPDEVLVAGNATARNLKELKLIALLRKPAPRTPQDRLHHASHALGANDEHGLLPALHGYGLQQSEQSEAVVPMQVREQNRGNPRGPEDAAHAYVMLRSFSTVHQDGSAGAQEHRQAGHVALPWDGHCPARAQEEHLLDAHVRRHPPPPATLARTGTERCGEAAAALRPAGSRAARCPAARGCRCACQNGQKMVLQQRRSGRAPA